MSVIKKELDYAIRIVAYLMGRKGMVKTEEISKKLFISFPNTIKILHKLAKCGVVITKTGKNGGILLNVNIEDMSIYKVMECMGFESEISTCVDLPESCKLNPICNVTHFFSEVQNDLIGKLKNAKIKNFIFDEEALNKIGG